MTTISRADFAAAIAAGIDAAPGLTPRERAALLHVARTAKRIGGSFSQGCPVVRARIVPRDYGTALPGTYPTHHAAEDFIDAYDGAMCRALPVQYVFADYIRITEDDPQPPPRAIPVAEIVAAIGADDTDEEGVIAGSAGDQLSGLYELLDRYGYTVA